MPPRTGAPRLNTKCPRLVWQNRALSWFNGGQIQSNAQGRLQRLGLVFPSKSTEDKTTVDDLVNWRACFWTHSELMSDAPMHIRSKTLRLLASYFQNKHLGILTDCPWSNDAAERLGNELVLLTKDLNSESNSGKITACSRWPYFKG